MLRAWLLMYRSQQEQIFKEIAVNVKFEEAGVAAHGLSLLMEALLLLDCMLMRQQT